MRKNNDYIKAKWRKSFTNLHITLRRVHLMRHRLHCEPFNGQFAVAELPINVVLVNVAA